MRQPNMMYGCLELHKGLRALGEDDCRLKLGDSAMEIMLTKRANLFFPFNVIRIQMGAYIKHGGRPQ